MLLNRDMLACLPTGYRKSFIFSKWPTVCRELARVNKDTQSENTVVLVVSPMIMIIEDQVKTLQSIGVAVAYTKQDPDTDRKRAAGKYSIVYRSPETFKTY